MKLAQLPTIREEESSLSSSTDRRQKRSSSLFRRKENAANRHKAAKHVTRRSPPCIVYTQTPKQIYEEHVHDDDFGDVSTHNDYAKSGQSLEKRTTALIEPFQRERGEDGTISMEHIVRLSLWSSLPIVVVDALTRLLDLFEEEETPIVDDSIEEGCTKLGNICDNKIEFLLLGGPLAVLRALHQHSDSVEIQVTGCQVLSSLLRNQSVSRFWITYLGCGLGAVAAVVAALKEWSDSVPVQEAGFRLLMRLVSSSPSNAKEFCEAGGIVAIARRAARYPKSGRTKSDICLLLQKLCTWEEARATLLDVEAVVFLSLPTLREGSESTNSSKTSVTSLSSFASSGASNGVSPSDESSEHSACSAPSLSEVLVMAPGPTIQKTSKSRSYRKSFAVCLPTASEVEQAAEEVQVLSEATICSLLKAFSTELWDEDDEAVNNALNLILTLLLKMSSSTLSTLLAGIGPLALVKVVERASKHDSRHSTCILQKSFQLIQILASRLEGFRALFHDLSAIEVLVASLRQERLRSDSQVVRMCLVALRELLRRSRKAKHLVARFAGAGGIEALIQIMAQTSRDQSVQFQACKVLHLCANTREHRGRLVRAGAMGAILAVIENHADSPTPLAAAKRVIQDFV